MVWVQTFDSGSNDFAGPLAVDTGGNVHVGGWVENATTDWLIAKYDQDGTQLWFRIVDGGNDEGVQSLAVDPDGFLYVFGDTFTGTHYRTIKYDSEGNIMWDLFSDPGGEVDNKGRGMKLDDAGFVYLTGYMHNGTSFNYWTLKYEQHPDQPDAGTENDAGSGTDAGTETDSGGQQVSGDGNGCGCRAQGQASSTGLFAVLFCLMLLWRRRKTHRRPFHSRPQ